VEESIHLKRLREARRIVTLKESEELHREKLSKWLSSAETFSKNFDEIAQNIDQFLEKSYPNWERLHLDSELEIFCFPEKRVKYPVYNKVEQKIGEVIISVEGIQLKEVNSVE